MEITLDLALSTILRSMTEVILPALDSSNKLAQEQSQLVVGLLTLLSNREPDRLTYTLTELEHYKDLAVKLNPFWSSDILKSLTATAEELLDKAKGNPDTEVILNKLRREIADIAGQVSDGTDKAAREARTLILSACSEQQLRERSWLLMQGWETDPSSIPELSELLRLRQDDLST